MDSQRTDEVSSLFNSFPSSGRTPRFKPGAQEEPLDDHASFSSESDNEAVTVYHAPTTDNSSWNFGLEEEDLEEMRRLRSESAAQRQKAAAAAEKQARNTKTDSLVKSRDEIKSVPVAEVDSDGEDDDVPRSPLKPRLKIKLKLPIVPASSTSNTATPVPEEQKVTPSRRAVAKRSAAVRGRRRIQDMESSSSEIESEDGESELVEDEEDEEDDDMQVSVDNSSVTAHTLQGRSKSRSMTTRQAVLASVMDSSHIALDSDLAAQSVQGNTSKKKKVLNETELALRREENARKRKNLSEKRLEDEKLETINRLLKKQSRPRTKRAGGPSQAHSAGSSVPPAPVISSSTGNRGGKRGGARGGARGRGGRRGRPRAVVDEEGGEAEVDAEGDAMEVDGQEGEGEEGVEGGNEVEGEVGDAPDGSIGGIDRSKGMQAPMIPMFRWVSTTVLVPTEISTTVAKPLSQDQPIGEKTEGDTKMADAGNVPAQSVEPDKTTLSPSPNDDALAPVSVVESPSQERRVQFSLAIPAAFLPPENSAPLPLTEIRPPAICAVSGCGDPRKYRLVKDWKIGACGMAHLKVLEGMSVICEGYNHSVETD
ncbi:hypothetical protein HHX47_DHR8000315 [Lentinula edodes]|nr:hypothetical protein HHX47_DHR8000315 [Lentinula edodes]